MRPGSAVRALKESTRFHRVEYGKLCKSPNGPIMAGSECHSLVVSPDIPAELEKQCRPWRLGVGEDLEPDRPHASVLRPARVGDGVTPVAYRLRRRPEDREGGRARRFWQGRYLFPATGWVDPWTAYLALQQQPLSGIVDLKDVEPSITVECSAVPLPAEPLGGFLREAARFTLSGIPVAIQGLLARRSLEEEFFLYAHALWRLLPETLRPLFAAAWGAQSALAPGFQLSAVAMPPPTVAVYHYPEGRWQSPKSLRVLEKLDPKRADGWGFKDIHLAPGKFYWQELQTAAGEAWDPEAPVENPGFLEELEAPVLREPEAPVFDSVEMFRAFRRPGELCADQIRQRALQQWLEGGEGRAEELARATDQYFFSTSRHRVLAAGISALDAADRERRCRGAQVVWLSLKAGATLEPSRPGPAPVLEVAALRFLAVLALWHREPDDQQVSNALAKRFQEVVDMGGDPSELPEEVTRLWGQALARGLRMESQARLHVQLLVGSENHPRPGHESYLRWAREQSRPLAAAIAQIPAGTEEEQVQRALHRLGELSADPLVDLLKRWREGRQPQAGDPQILAAQEGESRCCLLEVLESAWKPEVMPASIRQRREALIPWLELAMPVRAKDPLLRLVVTLPPPSVTNEDLQQFLKELHGNRVPPALEPKLAAVLFENWSRVHLDLERLPNKTIFRHWPPELCEALGVEVSRAAGQKGAAEVLSRLGAFRPDRSVLGARLSSPRKWPSSKDGLDGAKLLWNWCRDFRDESRGSEPSAVELCRSLALGGFPEREPAAESLDQVACLARAARIFPTANKELCDQWQQALQGWQIRLLLDAAPKADLVPTPHQLDAIASVHHRRWLVAHLNRDISKQRPERFLVAAAEFQEIPGFRKWQPEFSGSVLWAAFRDLPPSHQGDLRKALYFYSDSGDGPDPRKMAELALGYFSRQEDRPEAARRITRALLLTWAQEDGLGRPELKEVIAWTQRQMRKVAEPPPRWFGHRRAFRVVSLSRAFRRFDKNLVEVADWLFKLLSEFLAEGLGPELEKEVDDWRSSA